MKKNDKVIKKNMHEEEYQEPLQIKWFRKFCKKK